MKKIISALALATIVHATDTNAMECNTEFSERFKEYFIAKNLAAILNLYNMKGVDKLIKESIDKSITNEFGQTIESINIEDFKDDVTLSFEREGRKYAINTKPTKELRIKFKEVEAQKKGLTSTGMSFYLGLENGECKIATAGVIQGS